MIPDAKERIESFQVGDKADLVHLPLINGSEIRIPVTVSQVLSDGYLVDTPNQVGIKVRLRDLTLRISN